MQSPSGRLIAVTNLVDGIDWYSVIEGTFKGTTAYKSIHSNYMIDIAFLDKTNSNSRINKHHVCSKRKN